MHLNIMAKLHAVTEGKVENIVLQYVFTNVTNGVFHGFNTND